MRYTNLFLLISLGTAGLAAQAAPPEQPKVPGLESPGYEWNAPIGERVEVLRRKGNAERGREAYRVCQGCHKPDGSGLADGTYPQLAGQHASVLIKQMADIREGRRDNPKMFPFAGKHVIDVQEVADIAVFLERLPIPPNNGKGPGKDLARAQALYDKDCKSCHGGRGEGSARRFYPVLAGQHYEFLLRQSRDIQAGKRRNANPKMIKVIKKYSDADMAIVADYMSRLPAPVRKTRN
jgi:cytochrome c553